MFQTATTSQMKKSASIVLARSQSSNAMMAAALEDQRGVMASTTAMMGVTKSSVMLRAKSLNSPVPIRSSVSTIISYATAMLTASITLTRRIASARKKATLSVGE